MKVTLFTSLFTVLIFPYVCSSSRFPRDRKDRIRHQLSNPCNLSVRTGARGVGRFQPALRRNYESILTNSRAALCFAADAVTVFESTSGWDNSIIMRMRRRRRIRALRGLPAIRLPSEIQGQEQEYLKMTISIWYIEHALWLDRNSMNMARHQLIRLQGSLFNLLCKLEVIMGDTPRPAEYGIIEDYLEHCQNYSHCAKIKYVILFNVQEFLQSVVSRYETLCNV